MAAPGDVDVWVGLDVGKKEHFADVLDDDGERLFARAVANSQADLETLRDALTSISPALERAVGERLGQPGIRDLMVKYPTLTALRAASQSHIERTIKVRSPRIAGRRDALAAEIEDAFLSHPSADLLASMPGIGPRTGARILAEVGDGSAFTSGSKLAAYAGLAPVTRQSGTSLNAETRSRRGNHQLAWVSASWAVDRASRVRLAPASARPSAMALPMPRPVPVPGRIYQTRQVPRLSPPGGTGGGRKGGLRK